MKDSVYDPLIRSILFQYLKPNVEFPMATVLTMSTERFRFWSNDLNDVISARWMLGGG